MLINPLSREPFDLSCRREAPVQARASCFFSGASGTIVSGPAHFTSSTGAQVAVHIHRMSQKLEYNLQLMRIKSVAPSANIMNTAEQLNPTVHTEESQTSAVFLTNSTPFRMLASSASSPSSYLTDLVQTAADVVPPKDNEIYERLLRRKGRGFALYVPEPNMQLPVAYQKIGINIGDVGVITPDGGFSFLFNICAPANDPINPRILPEDFSPLQPTLTDVDVVKFPRFKSGSYLASASIEKKESESNTRCVAPSLK